MRPFDLLGGDILKLQSTHHRSQFHTHIIEHGFNVFALTLRVTNLLQLVPNSVEGIGNLGYRHFGCIVNRTQIARDVTQVRALRIGQPDRLIDLRQTSEYAHSFISASVQIVVPQHKFNRYFARASSQP